MGLAQKKKKKIISSQVHKQVTLALHVRTEFSPFV